MRSTIAEGWCCFLMAVPLCHCGLETIATRCTSPKHCMQAVALEESLVAVADTARWAEAVGLLRQHVHICGDHGTAGVAAAHVPGPVLQRQIPVRACLNSLTVADISEQLY